MILMCCCYCTGFTHHIVGGEVYYVYVGVDPSTHKSIYTLTLRLFRNCYSEANAAPLPSGVILSIFVNNAPYNRIQDINVTRSSYQTSTLTTYPVCISFKPPVCYQIGTYSKNVELDDNTAGYQIAFQTCCRAGSINVIDNSNSMDGSPGATYVGLIPGTSQLPAGHNSSAVFKLKDTALICGSSRFSLDFGALDADPEDSLSYNFAASYDGGNILDASNQPAGPPPYRSLEYDEVKNFDPQNPLGPGAVINHGNGVISGVAPAEGNYVVCVAVFEWRNGRIISIHRKDFILVVSNCKIPQAALPATYMNCDSLSIQFPYTDKSRLVHSYHWDFGVNGTDVDTSNLQSPSFLYPDTGTYRISLIVNRGEQCTDTGYANVIVYPGFNPKFGVFGNCVNEPYQFRDSSTTKYGTVNYWQWNYDISNVDPDGSSLQNPDFQYATTGTRTVQLIVGNSKGCLDTVYQTVDIQNAASLYTLSHDTLICSIDSLQLQAITAGSLGGYDFSWTPSYNITNTTIADPLAFPKTTTIYRVSIDDHRGCSSSDSIRVNVIDRVSLDLGPDPGICQGDSILLNPTTDGLKFSWSPAMGLSDPTLKNPEAAPSSTMQYSLTASVGHCSTTSAFNIKVVPYPQANAGPDTAICYGFSTVLQGSIKGAYFNWTPVDDLSNGQRLNPTASPLQTTAYILTVTDTLGCPKPFRDTVLVTVYPKVAAFAGNDTSVVVNQPLQLHASGGENYSWSPSTGMDNPFINTPVITPDPSIDMITYTLTVETADGCFGSDDITVKIFKTGPDIFVPNAFTPNGDGRNDLLRPIMAGIQSLEFFRVYNRWGELVFSTNQAGGGWDGNINGRPQPVGTYVYSAQAIDYLGHKITKKGTATLIR